MPLGTANPYAAYQSTGIKTASPGQLVVKLYQGAVKVLVAADECFNDGDSIPAPHIEPFGKHLAKAQEIIGELEGSLNMDEGGTIAQNLMSLYIYFNQELQTVLIRHDRKKLRFVLDMMRQLSDAWETAASTTPTSNVAQPAVNLEG